MNEFFLNNAGELGIISLRRGKTKTAQGNGRAKESPSQTLYTLDYKQTCQAKGHNTTTTCPPSTILLGLVT